MNFNSTVNFDIDTCADNETLGSFQELLKAGKIAEVISAWVKPERSCYITGQIPDDTAQRIYVVLTERGKDVLSASANAELMYAQDPRIRDLMPPPLQAKDFEKEYTDADRLYYKRMEEVIGENFDEEFLNETCDMQSSLLIAYGLAASNYGEVQFLGISEDDVEESPDPEYYSTNFLHVSCSRTNAERNFIETRDFYVDLSSKAKG